ncbi:glycosyltransferase [Frigoribacterium sp. UYMn621]|uniref:glycosyltransferase n=1 Tax=Frigoribacterium sp. UYMn621 TaxID=3156343 RepID=UPI0033909373
MTGTVHRVALVSMHSSPAALAGSGDSGGMNVSLLATATELAARGVEVDLVTRTTGSAAVTSLADGVELHELAAGGPGVIAKDRLGEVADEFGEAVAQLTGRASPRYDIIHAHYWLSGLATLPVALELGLPFVQSFHTLGAMKNANLAPGQTPEPERRLLTEMYLANQASAIVAGSSAEVSSLIDAVRAPADRVWVIPPGVDVDLFTPMRADAAESRVRRELGIAAGRPIIAVVGRVQPLKDQELAIRVLAELHALRDSAAVLVVAGEATPGEAGYAASLQSTAAELGVLAEVRFAGALSRERLADLLAIATVTLVPSHSETFGLVALESAASGTPVIAFRGGGLVESVSAGVSGLLVDSRDPRAWAQATVSLLDDGAGLQRLSGFARHYAEGFTWAATATALIGVYASLGRVGGSAQGRP